MRKATHHSMHAIYLSPLPSTRFYNIQDAIFKIGLRVYHTTSEVIYTCGQLKIYSNDTILRQTRLSMRVDTALRIYCAMC